MVTILEMVTVLHTKLLTPTTFSSCRKVYVGSGWLVCKPILVSNLRQGWSIPNNFINPERYSWQLTPPQLQLVAWLTRVHLSPVPCQSTAEYQDPWWLTKYLVFTGFFKKCLWLHIANWILSDSQLSWESKMEPSVAIIEWVCTILPSGGWPSLDWWVTVLGMVKTQGFF